MSQQRSKAAAQLWGALQDSKCLADGLKSPWRAEEACQQLAELLESVTSLLSHVFGRYRDSLFISALNTHLQSSAQLLHFGLLKASRVADSCCGSPGPYSNSSKSAFVPSEAIQSTATSAAADIQLAVTVLATAVQYLEATQTLKQAEAAAVHYIANMKTGQLLRTSVETPSSMNTEPFAGLAVSAEAAAELPMPAASICDSAAPAVNGSSLQTRRTPRSSMAGQQRQLQNADAVAVRAAARDNSSTTSDLALPEAAVAAVTATEAVQAAQASLQDLHQQQQRLLQQQDKVQACQQQHTTALQDVPAGVLDATSTIVAEHSKVCGSTAGVTARPRSPFESPEPEVTHSAYHAARLRALRELLKPGSTWSAAADGSNFQYMSPTCDIMTSKSVRQQQQIQLEPASQHQQGLQETPQQQQQQQQQDCQHAEPLPAGAGSPGSTSIMAQQQQQQEQEQEEEGTGVQHDSKQEMAHTSTWLAQQLQQVYNNPLLQGPRQQQQRNSLLRRSLEISSGTAPSSNLQGFAVDPTATPSNLASKQQQQLSTAAIGLGPTTKSPNSDLSTTAGGKIGETPEFLSANAELQQPAAVTLATGRLSSTSGCGCKGDEVNPGFVRVEGLGLRDNSDPGVMRRSTTDLVSDLLGRNRASSSSSSSNSVRSSLQGSILGPGGTTPAAAARHSTGGSSGVGWAGNGMSSGSGPSPSVLVTSATGASLVQMLAAAAAGAAGSRDGGSLAAAVRQQLGSPAPSVCEGVTGGLFTDSPAAGAGAGAAGSVAGISESVADSPAVDWQRLSSRYHRHTTDMLLGGSSSRTSGSSGLRYLRHTVDGVSDHRTASPPGSRVNGSPHPSALGPRNSNALRGSSSSSSDRGCSRSYVERYKMSSSRPRSADGAARHAAAAVAAERSPGQRIAASAAAVGRRRSAETVRDSGDAAMAAAGTSGSTGLESLVLLQQLRWQRQQQQNQSRQQVEGLAIGLNYAFPSAAAAVGAVAVGKEAAQTTDWEQQQQQQQHDDFEQQWQQQQQLWQQQHLQQEHCSGRGDGSRRGSTTDDEHMHELSFSVDGSSQLQQQGLVSPDLAQPDLTQPGVAQPDLTQPGVAQPDLTQPGVAQPDLTQPGVAQPDLTQPGVAQPDLTQPGVAQPDLTQPGVAQPDLTQPGVAQPDLTQPGVAQPDLTQPDLSRPDLAQPELAQAGIAQPDLALPDLAQPFPATSAGEYHKTHADGNSSSSCMMSTPDNIGASSTSFGDFQSGDGATAAAPVVVGQTSQHKPLARPRASGREGSGPSAAISSVQKELQEITSSSSSSDSVVAAAAANDHRADLTIVPVSGPRASGRDSYSSSSPLELGATGTVQNNVQDSTSSSSSHGAAESAAAVDDLTFMPVSAQTASGRDRYISQPPLDSDTIVTIQNNQQDSPSSSSNISVPSSSVNRSSLMVVSTDGATAPPAAAAVHDSSNINIVFQPTSSSNRSSLMTMSVSGAAATAAGGMTAAAAPAAAAAAELGSDPEAAAAASLLTSGNAAYTAGNYSAAAAEYRAAMDKLGGSLAHSVSNSVSDSCDHTTLFMKCSLNLACCHLRLGQYKQCLAECNAILYADPSHVVALCHRGRALLMLQQPAAAKADLETAEQLLAEEAGQQQGLAAAAAARPVTPNTLARMRLNNSYWQQRVQQLLGKLPPDA